MHPNFCGPDSSNGKIRIIWKHSSPGNSQNRERMDTAIHSQRTALPDLPIVTARFSLDMEKFPWTLACSLWDTFASLILLGAVSPQNNAFHLPSLLPSAFWVLTMYLSIAQYRGGYKEMYQRCIQRNLCSRSLPFLCCYQLTRNSLLKFLSCPSLHSLPSYHSLYRHPRTSPSFPKS